MCHKRGRTRRSPATRAEVTHPWRDRELKLTAPCAGARYATATMEAASTPPPAPDATATPRQSPDATVTPRARGGPDSIGRNPGEVHKSLMHNPKSLRNRDGRLVLGEAGPLEVELVKGVGDVNMRHQVTGARKPNATRALTGL